MLSQINITVFDAQTHGVYGALKKELNNRPDFDVYKTQYDTFMKHLCGANVFTCPTTAIALDYAVVDDKRQVYLSRGNYAYIRLDKNLRNFNESFKRTVGIIWDSVREAEGNSLSNFGYDWQIGRWLKEN